MKEYIVQAIAQETIDSFDAHNAPELVRCKDCKHGKIHGIDVECVAHEEVGYDPEPWHPLDWFCADGERN